MGWPMQLLYLDPPFGSGKVYRRAHRGRSRPPIGGGARLYRDDQDFDAYLAWLFRRLAFPRDLLTDSGMLYVHLDWHAVHYVKVELDRLFGRARFLNEIIWCYHGPSPIRTAFKRKHDTILAYTRNPDYFFDVDAVRVPYDESTIKTFAGSRKAGFGKVPDLARGKVPEDWWYFPVVARYSFGACGLRDAKTGSFIGADHQSIQPPRRPGGRLLCGDGHDGGCCGQGRPQCGARRTQPGGR